MGTGFRDIDVLQITHVGDTSEIDHAMLAGSPAKDIRIPR
jgi:hypothetical protein|tara:strand:+ start:376 stop:495 length:120 start_codon:yes stop_codon:yes gene_type:complete